MRPKLIMLLVLMAGTVVFMSFLIKQSATTKMVCEKKDCCKKPEACPDGGGNTPTGSFNHLIVSTIK
jgi:hypothetical protein